MGTKGRPVPAAEYGVMAAARQAVEVMANAAPATRRPRPSRPG